MGERRSIIIISASIAVVVAMLLVWALAPSARNNVSSIPLTEISDTATIQTYLQLSHLSIATSENFARRSEEHTSESSHLVISYAVFCLKKKKKKKARGTSHSCLSPTRAGTADPQTL